MKRLMLIVLILGLFTWGLYAQALTAQFSPSSIEVNVLNATSFDPVDPSAQPILTSLTIMNNSAETYRFDMRLRIFWNSAQLVTTSFRSSQEIMPNSPYFTLTNRDLITQDASQYFDDMPGTSNNISLQDVIDHNSTLRNALLSGFFPDGTLRLQIELKKASETNWGSPVSFSIRIRNAGTIFPVYPGKPIGQNPPQIGYSPITFVWNSIATGFNTYHLHVKEFAPNNPPTNSNVNTSGALFHQAAIANGAVFSDFLPFQNNYYYAWRISTDIYNEANPSGSGSGAASLNSNWFTFKFVQDSDDQSALELISLLNLLSHPLIQNLFSEGYLPTGRIFLDGRVYTGAEALELLGQLIGKDLTITISN